MSRGMQRTPDSESHHHERRQNTSARIPRRGHARPRRRRPVRQGRGARTAVPAFAGHPLAPPGSPGNQGAPRPTRRALCGHRLPARGHHRPDRHPGAGVRRIHGPHYGAGDRAHPPSHVCSPSRGRERPDQAGAGVSERGRRGPGPPTRRRQGPAQSGESDLLGPSRLPELMPSRVHFQQASIISYRGSTTMADNMQIVLNAFETLFNKRDYAAAERFWSPNYIQHSAHIPPGREGLFALIKGAPEALHYENGLTVANGDYVLLHGRFSGLGRPANWIVVDIVRLENGQLAEHWDVIQDEVTKEASVSGLPMFGDKFPG